MSVTNRLYKLFIQQSNPAVRRHVVSIQISGKVSALMPENMLSGNLIKSPICHLRLCDVIPKHPTLELI